MAIRHRKTLSEISEKFCVNLCQASECEYKLSESDYVLQQYVQCKPVNVATTNLWIMNQQTCTNIPMCQSVTVTVTVTVYYRTT